MKGIYKSEAGAVAIRDRYLAFLKRWPVENQQFHVPTREGDTFVVACGDKHAPPLVLFHGSASNSTMWMGDITAWAAHFRVYSIDMIGEPGLSARARPPLGSDAYALWLDDVMQSLAIDCVSLVGISLGGWLALDYATRRPERVESIVTLCPAGVGRQKLGIILKAIALSMCGAWGTRKLREMILGRTPAQVPAAFRPFMDFVSLIHEHFRPRRGKIPLFSDAALQRLTMPVMAILGGQDVLLDSAGTKRRLQDNVAHADIRYLPDAGHLIRGQTNAILEFLQRVRGGHDENSFAGDDSGQYHASRAGRSA